MINQNDPNNNFIIDIGHDIFSHYDETELDSETNLNSEPIININNEINLDTETDLDTEIKIS